MYLAIGGRLRVDRELLRMSGIATIFLFLGYVTQTIGLQTTTASNSAFITVLYVIFVPVFLRRFQGRTWFSAGLALTGLWFLVTPSLEMNVGPLDAGLRRRLEIILVCGDADSVWGFVSYRASRCHLGMWYVDPDYQGQGIGKALLQAAEEGLSFGHREEAWTEASLFAIPRCESLGWNVTEQYDKPFAGSSFRVARMTKVLG